MASPRLAVLVSGSGTILEAIVARDIPVALVIADRPCRALEVANDAGINSVLVDRANFGGFSKSFDRDGYTQALVTALAGSDLVAMAGFGTITSARFFTHFSGRVLNTHPSLLPLFKGWHAVRDALAAGATESGCTVHVATEALDDGPILAQVRVAVAAHDDEASLHERIKIAERELYPTVIANALATLASGGEITAVR